MSYKQFSVIIILAVFICPVSLSGAVLNVPAEYATIADAIDAAGPCDTVLLATGTYSGVGFRDLHLDGRCLHLMSASGPDETGIDLENLRFLFVSDSEQTGGSDVSVRGITFLNGEPALELGNFGKIDIHACVFHGGFVAVADISTGGEGAVDSCVIRGCGVGLVLTGQADWTISNSFFIGNGNGVSCHSIDEVEITGCTFGNNGGAIQLDLADFFVMTHNLFYRNSYAIEDDLYATQAVLECNDYFGNTYNIFNFAPGDQIGINGNISADPMLCDTTLESISVLPSSPLLAENNDCGVNIGNVYEGCICADLNGSGGLPDISDLTFYVDYMFGGGEPPIHINTADIDGEGGVNISDLTYFVDYLFASGPPPIC